MRKRTAGIAAAAVAVVVAAVALPLFQPWRLATDKVVDEALPGAVPISTTSSSTTPPTVSVEPKQPTPQPTQPPRPQPKVLLTGKLITHEHRTSGTVAVLALPDGSRVLRIENLDTSDGPDLKVWLSDAQVTPGRAGWHVFDDGQYRSLGSLKGNHGNQNYVVPHDLNLESFRSVAIWCDRFNVSFGAATLA
ncbi:electron transfer DM13 [Kribbella sp. VKM Ac-2569]|uniref:DM13 domain-containing protein n=1 Tax=Kribbella sp. VKM Ac-2569 TaxID=2512220 RepID=UPI00102AD931|nr:DM13 domain-containing protein [Kribbella sp. VKM Ac-2569]RZT26666.1 electron transfer DM13 [Kribbella sp. VKM Ac-2569]